MPPRLSYKNKPNLINNFDLNFFECGIIKGRSFVIRLEDIISERSQGYVDGLLAGVEYTSYIYKNKNNDLATEYLMDKVIPRYGKIFANNKLAYSYLIKSIEEFPNQIQFTKKLKKTHF